ncbi:MAG: hypothetical protein K1V80_06495 [Muribaculaceae bacterium]
MPTIYCLLARHALRYGYACACARAYRVKVFADILGGCHLTDKPGADDAVCRVGYAASGCHILGRGLCSMEYKKGAV